jgi:hypothetical protein
LIRNVSQSIWGEGKKNFPLPNQQAMTAFRDSEEDKAARIIKIFATEKLVVGCV